MLDINPSAKVLNGRTRTPTDIIREGIVDLPAADAALLLRECRYPEQKRDLSPDGQRHIDVLSELMRTNHWRDLEKIDFVRISNRIYIVNGHHRFGAQVVSGRKIRWIFAIHEIDSMEAAAELYWSFDTNVRSRTKTHVLGIMNAAELLGLSKTTTAKLYDAVPLIIAGFDFAKSAADPLINRIIEVRMEKMKSYMTEAQKWENAVDSAPVRIKRRLMTQGAMAVALVCFRHAPVDAIEFWGGLADDDGLKKGDPRKAYKETLEQKGSGGTSYTLAMQASLAWNAFYNNRNLQIVKIMKNARFRILGTPYGN